MEKIFNSPKVNVYGGTNMKNKYIYMSRKYDKYIEHYIYRIDDILNEIYPTKYKSSRSYKLTIFNDYNKKITLDPQLNEIELLNWDVLYEINIDEFLKYFKIFIEYDGKLGKEFPKDIFDK